MSGKFIYNTESGHRIENDFESENINDIFTEFYEIHEVHPHTTIQYVNDKTWMLFDKSSQDSKHWSVVMSDLDLT